MTVAPLRREVVVATTPDVAFRVFTERIGAWWPVGEFSVYGEGTHVAFVDQQDIVETGTDGQRATWGTVTSWQPGREIAFTWHPGRADDQSSRVTVTFAAVDGGTLVSLVHDGWEVFAEPDVARTEYGQGWPIVLEGYARVAAATS